MRYSFTKITIVRINQEVPEQIDEELQWIGSSLGLFNLRDKDKSCYRIFITNNRIITIHFTGAVWLIGTAPVIHIYNLVSSAVYVDLRILHPISQTPMVPDDKNKTLPYSGELTPIL